MTTRQPSWVKCSERMPARSGYYWTMRDGRQESSYLHTDGSWNADKIKSYKSVTHWLDAPDPEPDDRFEEWWESHELIPGAPYLEVRNINGFKTHIGQAIEIWRAALLCNGVKIP